MNRRPRAFTVLETVVAMFLIVMAAIVAGQMLNLSLRASGIVRDESTALLLAQRKLREIEAWSRQRGASGLNFNGPWPDGLNGNAPAPPFMAAPDDDYPAFTVQAQSAALAVSSPAPDLRRFDLDGSARLVKVTVTWGSSSFAMRARTWSLCGLVREPPRRLTEIQVDGPAALRAGQVSTFAADGRDADGSIPGLVYRWDAVPIDGNVTLDAAGRGQTATVTNAYTYANGHRYATGGRCRLRVSAMADGQVVTQTQIVDLGSPEGPLGAP